MTTTTTSMPASTSGGTAVRTRRPVSQVSIAAGAAALVVIEAYGAIAHAAGVPLRAAAFGAHTATQVNAGWLAFGVALGTFWGTVLAVVFQVREAQLQVLLWERALDPFAGSWSLPAGELAGDETLEQSPSPEPSPERADAFEAVRQVPWAELVFSPFIPTSRSLLEKEVWWLRQTRCLPDAFARCR